MLEFSRDPFQDKSVTVMVPWNEMVTVRTITLRTRSDVTIDVEQNVCDVTMHDYDVMRPVIVSTWQHTQLRACPDRSAVIPESQVRLFFTLQN